MYEAKLAEVDVLREAFVICPMSRPETEIRRRSDALLEAVVEPILEGRHQCTVGRADFFADDPDFMEVIHGRIARADLIVADLTGLNANVLYELGHCHMLGIPVVMFIDSVANLPSDIRNHKAIEYSVASLADKEVLSSIMSQFALQVRGARGFVPRTQPEMVAQRMVKRFGLTTVEEVHTGRRDHYKMAQRVVAARPQRICLLQRSSTLILGPEAGWGDEAGFYEALWGAIAAGTEVFHVVTLDGIVRHVQRAQSEFPETSDAVARLVRVGESVGIPAPTTRDHAIPIKLFPNESQDVDLKPDRQARALFADFGSHTEALVVMDFGGRQMSVRLKGPESDSMFHTGLDFYSACETLRWDELLGAFRAVGHEVHLPADSEGGA